MFGRISGRVEGGNNGCSTNGRVAGGSGIVSGGAGIVVGGGGTVSGGGGCVDVVVVVEVVVVLELVEEVVDVALDTGSRVVVVNGGSVVVDIGIGTCVV